jgi:uncharacterized membrane protein
MLRRPLACKESTTLARVAAVWLAPATRSLAQGFLSMFWTNERIEFFLYGCMTGAVAGMIATAVAWL